MNQKIGIKHLEVLGLPSKGMLSPKVEEIKSNSEKVLTTQLDF
jgi:hypothetical protein